MLHLLHRHKQLVLAAALLSSAEKIAAAGVVSVSGASIHMNDGAYRQHLNNQHAYCNEIAHFILYFLYRIAAVSQSVAQLLSSMHVKKQHLSFTFTCF
jgi:hypothetical protein